MKISRKTFIKYVSIMVAAPLIIFNSLDCGEDKTAVDEPSALAKDNFSNLIYAEPTVVINSSVKIEGKGSLIPKKAVTGNDSPFVFRIINKDSRALFESVNVQIIEASGENLIVSNLRAGDIILSNPAVSLTHLRKIDIYQLKRRFVLTQHHFFGK